VERPTLAKYQTAQKRVTPGVIYRVPGAKKSLGGGVCNGDSLMMASVRGQTKAGGCPRKAFGYCTGWAHEDGRANAKAGGSPESKDPRGQGGGLPERPKHAKHRSVTLPWTLGPTHLRPHIFFLEWIRTHLYPQNWREGKIRPPAHAHTHQHAWMKPPRHPHPRTMVRPGRAPEARTFMRVSMMRVASSTAMPFLT